MSTISVFARSASATVVTLVPPTPVHDLRVVRFNDECILIPESRSRRPRILSKSYSLPLWKKKPQTSTSDSDPDDSNVVFKVPMPSFMGKSRSPTRGREPLTPPLQPCLVHRQPSSPVDSALLPAGRRTHMRRTSMPARHDLVTIPLRSCCPDCVSVMEASLKEGSSWQEKFSRGARRKRSLSLDGDKTGFPPIPEPLMGAGFQTVSVDEVDKRRKSLEEDEATRVWDFSAHDRDRSSSSTSSASSSGRHGDGTSKPDVPRVLPIEEEDEDQLFPLPSPRRSPTQSPAASPNTSTSCLGGLPSGSKDSLQIPHRDSPSSSSDDSHSSTRGNRCVKGLLTPESSPSMPTRMPAALRNLTPPPTNTPTHPPLHATRSSESTPIPTLKKPPHIDIPRAISATKREPTPPSTKYSLPPSPTSPTSPTIRRHRPSFSIPKPASILKAGADVLWGVGAVNAGLGHV